LFSLTGSRIARVFFVLMRLQGIHLLTRFHFVFPHWWTEEKMKKNKIKKMSFPPRRLFRAGRLLLAKISGK
jgi:hypothetical protein